MHDVQPVFIPVATDVRIPTNLGDNDRMRACRFN
jgi:hypothetical protein